VKKKLLEIGACRIDGAFAPSDWAALLSEVQPEKAGVRLHAITGLKQRIGTGSAPLKIAQEVLGPEAQPVRAIFFDKSRENNWALGWHQDRTIPVASRHNVTGFNRWTIKQGIQHVEPPFDIIADMVTLRLHLDGVSPSNAPLRIAPGSHRRGLILEQDYEETVEECGEFVCLAEAGDIWAYSTPILHASHAAESSLSRRVIQIDYSAVDLPQPLEWAGI
jgi:ectoine hydroxylase-related dioxygenase (phytanoyl-CoA dioxygenase family)